MSILNNLQICTVTLMWLEVKVLTHHLVMDNNCVKYYHDPAYQGGIMVGGGRGRETKWRGLGFS